MKNYSSVKKLNPSGKVPVFQHNGLTLTESLAIMEYIDEVFPGVPLLPSDPAKKAIARSIALHISCGIQPIQNLRVIQYLNKEEDGKGAKWAKHWLTEGLSELEQLLEPHAGKYCVGDEVSLADLCLPSIIYNGRRWGVDLTPFPIIRRIEKELEILPAFQKALPEQQPDAVKQ